MVEVTNLEETSQDQLVDVDTSRVPVVEDQGQTQAVGFLVEDALI
jgi:hypothetical protein